MLSCSHVSSMTGECTDPIYHQRAVNVENGTLLHLYEVHAGSRQEGDAKWRAWSQVRLRRFGRKREALPSPAGRDLPKQEVRCDSQRLGV